MRHGAVGMISIILKNLLRSVVVRLIIRWRDNHAAYKLQLKIAGARQMVNQQRGAQRKKAVTVGSTLQRTKRAEAYSMEEEEVHAVHLTQSDQYLAEQQRADAAEAKAERLSKLMINTYRGLQTHAHRMRHS